MIKFFRHIRLALINQNQMGKYFKYAIGEILLVVIGILIALQINNWNEERKQNNLEQEYLKALKTEFENNLNEVDRVIKLNAGLLKSAQKLAQYMGPEIPDITDKELSRLFFKTVSAEVQYRPGSGVTNEILNSGKLNIFKNGELKNALASHDGLLLRIRFQESQELSRLRYKLIDFVEDNVSSRRMAFDAFGELFGVDKGKFLDSNLHLLTSKKFDNQLAGFMYTSGFLEDRYRELKKQIQRIIKIIDSQIKK